MRYFLLSLLCILATACQNTPTQDSSPSPTSATEPTPTSASEASRKDGLSVGSKAPDVVVKDQDGKTLVFQDLYEKGPVLVYFYPKADTPGCTAQACSLRDSYEQLTDLGITVVGVSLDSQADQKAFQEKFKLPFLLVPDTEKVAVEAFGVSHIGGLASRQAFLIKDGLIQWHDNSASTAKQAEDVLAETKNWNDE